MGEDDGDVRQVQSRGGDVEDGHHGLGAADADAVQTHAEEHDQPDGVDGRMGEGVDGAEETAADE